jgi:hypothetical protein
MNLFFLDLDPKNCAKYHCDKHVVKMILEIVQMLYTAHNVLGTKNLPRNGYRSFNPHHPTAVWIRLCDENYTYAVTVADELAKEYRFRYNKVHSCEKHVDWLKDNKPVFKETPDPYKNSTKTVHLRPIPGMTCVPLAMPDDVMKDDPIKSYRSYYNVYKKRFARWTNRLTPPWFLPIQIQLFFN